MRSSSMMWSLQLHFIPLIHDPKNGTLKSQYWGHYKTTAQMKDLAISVKHDPSFLNPSSTVNRLQEALKFHTGDDFMRAEQKGSHECRFHLLNFSQGCSRSSVNYKVTLIHNVEHTCLTSFNLECIIFTSSS